MIDGDQEMKMVALGTDIRAGVRIQVTYTDEDGKEQHHIIEDPGPFSHCIFGAVRPDGPRPIMVVSLGDSDLEWRTLSGILAQSLEEGHHALSSAFSEMMLTPNHRMGIALTLHEAHIKTATAILEMKRAQEESHDESEG